VGTLECAVLSLEPLIRRAPLGLAEQAESLGDREEAPQRILLTEHQSEFRP
jgi:hypothetical protein